MFKSVFFVLIPQFCYCKEIYKVSFTNFLENDHDLDKLSKVLQTDGSLAITQLPLDYIRAINSLQEKSPNCLELHHFPKFHLPDGSLRRSWP